ncbi:YfhD family protein [Alteribacter natronophilus]|uniref:YfhD family protein n=1 Tax=Alteribacter natronophilus TaxID=2583810 RepID=UPI00110F5F7E|nr:YfhD family protein [Alteribacter natronophilus]TMW70588.1 YfhD family protein [Alteribacter natronophilus]
MPKEPKRQQGRQETHNTEDNEIVEYSEELADAEDKKAMARAQAADERAAGNEKPEQK